jgi:hypothetical protein
MTTALADVGAVPAARDGALAAAATACAHCGLPAAAATDDGPAFCCTGCAVVYRAIRGAGLEDYYAVRERAEPARTTERGYAELDDDAFARSTPRIGPTALAWCRSTLRSCGAPAACG